MVEKEKHIYRILETVTDPEIPVLTIADMGILRDVQLDGSHIKVTITPTYSGCPAMDMIQVNIRAALEDHGYTDVSVQEQLSPPWTTDWMTDGAKKKLEDYGIAPPVESTSDTSFLTDEDKIIPCPQCKSTHTKLVSQFGSTPCKSFHQCQDCKEPFDYFKCH